MTDITPAFDSDRFIRTLGAHERMLFLYSLRHPRHFSIAVEYRLGTNEEQLVDALEMLQSSFPVLRLCIRGAGTNGPGMFGTDSKIALDFCEPSVWQGWETVVAAELCRDFPTDAGPLLRTVAVSLEGRTQIVFTAHHAVMDALSLVTMAQKLGDILIGRVVDPVQLYPSMEEYFPRGNSALAPEELAGTLERLRFQSEKPLWRSFQGDAVHVYDHWLDKVETEKLRTKCRLQECTVHGAITAAAALAIGVSSGKEEITLASPINIRDKAGVDADAVGLFVSVHMDTLNVGDRSRFWELAKTVSHGLKQFKSGDGISSSVSRLSDLIRPDSTPSLAAGLVGAYNYDAVISNLGILPSIKRSPCIVDTIRGPFVLGRFINERTVGVSTFNGALRMVQTSPQNTVNILPDLIRHLSVWIAN
jgi:hypothetical protein